MSESKSDDAVTVLNGPDETPVPEKVAVAPLIEPSTEIASKIEITGDGNIVGDGNVSIVAKEGGTVNFSLWVDAAEMLIESLKALGLSDEEITNRLLELLASCGGNPALPQQMRGRAVEASIRIRGLTLAQIRVDKELLAILGLFLVGDLAKEVIQALRREHEEPPMLQTLPMSELEPQSQPKKRPKLAYRRAFEPKLVFVPAGKFLMGSDPRRNKDARENEQPQHTVYLPDYYIGKYPVTNAQYRASVQAMGYYAPGHWKDGRIPSGKSEHPVAKVSWHDAVAYCRWLADETGKLYRLPTEAEWEKAARGTDGRIWPWGDFWDPVRCNHWDGGVHDTTPVGQYSPDGDSPYGCADMAGNVWEWTSTRWMSNYERYDDKALNDIRDDFVDRVLRGGAFYDDQLSVRCACRLGYFPPSSLDRFGFRVVVSLSRA